MAWPDLHYQTAKGVLLLLTSPARIPPSQLRLVPSRPAGKPGPAITAPLPKRKAVSPERSTHAGTKFPMR